MTTVPDDEPIAAPAPRRPRRVWDIVLTIVLLVIYLVGCVVASASGLLLLAFGGDSCSATSCNYETMTTGMLVTFIGPWVPVLFVLAGAIVLLVLRRLAFWVPLVGGAITVATVILGYSLAGLGVG